MNDMPYETVDESTSEAEIEAEALACEEDKAETADLEDAAESTSSESTETSEIDSLREELTLLRTELEAKRGELERLGKEVSEFSELFPNATLTALPDSVWESVRGGIPLAAAYALYRRKAELRAEQARIVNKKNNEMSTGAIGRDTTDSFYTPDEVRAMTRSEIRKNYSKILDSMKKWS